MTAFDYFYAYDATIFLVLGLIVGIVMIFLGDRTRERVVDKLLVSFLLFSGTVRFLFLFIQDAFFSELTPGVQPAFAAEDLGTHVRVAFAQLAIAVLALFGLRASVGTRIVVVVPLAVVQLGTGVVWVFVAMLAPTGTPWPSIDTIVAVCAGVFGLVLLALDWANRSDEPDPLTPGGKPFAY